MHHFVYIGKPRRAHIQAKTMVLYGSRRSAYDQELQVKSMEYTTYVPFVSKAAFDGYPVAEQLDRIVGAPEVSHVRRQFCQPQGVCRLVLKYVTCQGNHH